jgi:threonine/homoserine/homoserine lactone efflux protein
MLGIPLFLGFLAAASILTLTPGLDTAMVLRSAAAFGPRPAAFAAAGIAGGCLAWGAVVSLGLGALLQASQTGYTILKLAGAAYLIFWGLNLLIKPRSAIRQPASELRATSSLLLRRGFLTNILNPKVGVFYISFLPQFIPHGANVALYAFFLACVHVALTLLWFALLIIATIPLGRLLQSPKIVKTLDRLTGAVFIGFGLKLLASKA